MVSFSNGPAAGVLLQLRRAPKFLRVVRDPGQAAAVCKKDRREWDALDQLDDAAKPAEQVFAYLRVGRADDVHLYFGGGRGCWLKAARYELVEPQPDDATMRATAAWRSWCEQEAKKIPKGV